MFVPRMNAVSKNPAVFITCCFYCIGKNMFMFPFPKPAALGIRGTAFLRFHTFRNLFFLFTINRSATRRRLILSFFSGAFSHVLPGLLRFLSVVLPHTRALVRVQAFYAFFAVCTCFHMGRIHKDMIGINQFKPHTFFQYPGKICSKRSVSLKRRV